MRGKRLLWVAAAVLVVALSALMPEAALRLQDRSLAGRVQSQVTDTADLSLLAELTPAQTLAMVTQNQSRVALEQGRRMDAAQAERVAVNTTNLKVLELSYATVYMQPTVSAVSSQPWLYMGATGESVIFWEVELSGSAYNPLVVFSGYTDEYASAMSFTGTALVDERSGCVVSLALRWTAGGIGGVPPTVEEADAGSDPALPPTAVPVKIAEEIMAGETPEAWGLDTYDLMPLCEGLVYVLLGDMSLITLGMDLDLEASTAYLHLDGEDVAVPLVWNMAEVRFNA